MREYSFKSNEAWDCTKFDSSLDAFLFLQAKIEDYLDEKSEQAPTKMDRRLLVDAEACIDHLVEKVCALELEIQSLLK